MNRILFLLIILSSLFAVYVEGQEISIEDQNISFDICSGDYPASTLSLSDFNGDLNGGDYKVMHIDMSASW